MDLRLHNTLTRSKETFEPIDAKNVRMYVCGPTVYDYAHIGNARPVIVFDVLYRLLRHKYGEKHVTYVRNITDVDDKINARALRDFPDLPLNEAIRNVTEKTANQFHKDVEALGCLPPTIEPRATEFVLPRADGKSDMATLIQNLLDKNHAYIATGGEGREVLFDVTSMDNYGALSNRKLEDQQAGARIEAKDHKKNAGDFVLWKESSANEPGWDATFNGEIIHGRPGWHIECSAMSAAYLGETFDIHGGGLDLIFPHHENEIAQSCCAHGTQKMANVWMHNGYLQVEGKKMSKSVGNFVTIYELLHTEKFGGRKWPGEVLRLAMLMTHYREPIDFSIKRLEEADSVLAKLWRKVAEGDDSGDIKTVINALTDDLNSSEAIAKLNSLSGDALGAALEMLGLSRTAPASDVDASVVEAAITERLAFFADKNFAEADRIRDKLLSQGIQLKDSKDSETGERVTTWEIKR
ncbi:cysteine--tRNA ligase [Ahrensia kielensis]|uniref:cysteine--tRNA ligase n=1 Tax=Ahrensia kielensis TaxID=76980 RepID=UPI00037CD129|nr:cysteine--tRNA ligase [Ahrensia kielensis]